LLDHVLARSFRPTAHQRKLLGDDLPLAPAHPDPSPAMQRLWARLRALQSEYRDVSSVEVRHDLSRQFSVVAGEYMDAVGYADMDPTADVLGIADVLAVNRVARQRYEREVAAGKARAK
jgi:hypothetical protein